MQYWPLKYGDICIRNISKYWCLNLFFDGLKHGCFNHAKISYRLCKDMVTVGRGVCFITKVDWSNPNLKKNDHDHDNVDISVQWLKLVFFAFPRFHWLERLARLDRQHLWCWSYSPMLRLRPRANRTLSAWDGYGLTNLEQIRYPRYIYVCVSQYL